MSAPAGEVSRAVTYPQFRSELFARHEAPMAAMVSTVGDMLLVGGPIVGLAARRWRVAAAGLAAGAAVTAAAHIFQPGTLRAELEDIVRHPIWATRAELDRITTMGR
jgi:hypothetical protein